MGITQEEVKELFEYSDGDLVWLEDRRSIKVKGLPAGTYDSYGYKVVKINNKPYKAHRLVWLYHYGYIPEGLIDHINRDRSDNRIENLREVNHQCNARNSGNSVVNTSGVKGVRIATEGNRWIARIKNSGKQTNLGYYKDFDEAVLARLAAEQCLNWHGCDSSSPAYRYYKENIK